MSDTPISILAGQTFDVRYDPETHEFRRDEALPGPVYTIQSLDFWQADEVQACKENREWVRKALGFGLLAIDGDADKVKAFIARPKARLAVPLYNLIWAETWGN